MASEMRRMKAPAARPAAKPTTIDPAEIASFGKVAAAGTGPILAAVKERAE